MFESSRPRQGLADEDAPPMTSVNDMMNEIPPDSSGTRFQSKTPFNSPLSRSVLPQKSHPTPPFHMSHSASFSHSSSAQDQSQPLYVIVFGYPPDKYSTTLEYFRSLGGDIGQTTEPIQNTQIVNCFKLGFNNPADAIRALKKNGEVLGGCWMVGVKWADPGQADAVLGTSLARGLLPVYDNISIPSPSGQADASSPMAVDEGFSNPSTNASPMHGGFSHTPTVGTPIKLAPSVSAFKKTGRDSVPRAGASSEPGANRLQQTMQSSPSKGVLGQVSNLIFGW